MQYDCPGRCCIVEKHYLYFPVYRDAFIQFWETHRENEGNFTKLFVEIVVSLLLSRHLRTQ